jgi:hypothetical protein
MPSRQFLPRSLAASVMLLAMTAHAQPAAPDMAKQKAAIARLDAFDGEWRGIATVSKPGNPPLHVIQTEQVGSSLGGAIKVIHGRSYQQDGAPSDFSAFAVVSFDEAAGIYDFRAYAQGRADSFPLTITHNGFEWRRAMGPSDAIRYSASINRDTWHEEGWFEHDHHRAAKIFEMDLQRLGPTAWPDDAPIPAR